VCEPVQPKHLVISKIEGWLHALEAERVLLRGGRLLGGERGGVKLAGGGRCELGVRDGTETGRVGRGRCAAALGAARPGGPGRTERGCCVAALGAAIGMRRRTSLSRRREGRGGFSAAREAVRGRDPPVGP
jgi:hypothetical protein